ncbi:hypothetical protein ES703_37453 [subsurface metagenome]
MAVRRRKLRMPAGESVLTRISRVKDLIAEYEAGGQPSKARAIKVLTEYHSFLEFLWLWQLKRKK